MIIQIKSTISWNSKAIRAYCSKCNLPWTREFSGKKNKHQTYHIDIGEEIAYIDDLIKFGERL